MKFKSLGTLRRERVQEMVDRKLTIAAIKKAERARKAEAAKRAKNKASAKNIQEGSAVSAGSVTGYGVIRAGGTVIISHRARFDEQLAAEFKVDERVRVTVDRENRRVRQNALYWLWCTMVGRERGWEKEYTHYLNKLTCNRKTIFIPNVNTGEIREETYPTSTATLSIDAFAEFMNRVQQRWAEEGIDLPSSNDQE